MNRWTRYAPLNELVWGVLLLSKSGEIWLDAIPADCVGRSLRASGLLLYVSLLD